MLYSYVVARDYGFAPNPFLGLCTLATCKPMIRKTADVGDWIVGTGSKGYELSGHLVFAMRVSEALKYDEYWKDPRFRQKRPNLKGSLKQAFGDNIYHRDRTSGEWIQEDSHHSLPGGLPNPANIQHDTQVSRVLIGSEFTYWGGGGPLIPSRFRGHCGGVDVCCQRFHKCRFPPSFVSSFIEWVQSLGETGYISAPKQFAK